MVPQIVKTGDLSETNWPAKLNAQAASLGCSATPVRFPPRQHFRLLRLSIAASEHVAGLIHWIFVQLMSS
jgi:hypothetical protein